MPFSASLGKKKKKVTQEFLVNFAAYHSLSCQIRQVITTICPLCQLNCEGTGRNSEETNYLFANQSERGTSAMNL